MRFAHLADSHLGYRQYGLVEREDDFYEVFERTVDKIIDLEVDFVIHSGDLFEMAKPSPKALLNFQRGFLKLMEAKIPVYAIAGNHDSVMRKGSYPPQILFRDLGLNLISSQKPAYVKGAVLICGVPFMSKSQNRVLLSYYNQLSQLAEKYPKAILVSHQGIDKYMPYKEAAEISLTDLPNNFDYYAMGHLHGYINEEYGKGRLVYPGSMEIWKSNELKNASQHGKGFCLVDITPDDPVVERIKIDLPRKYYREHVEYNKLPETIHLLKERINELDKKPIIEMIVENGEFTVSDVSEYVTENLKEDVLILRPKFNPIDISNPDSINMEYDSLDPRSLLVERLDEKYNNPDVSNLSIDLLDKLSKNNMEEAEYISDKYYDDNYKSKTQNNVENNSDESMKEESDEFSIKEESDQFSIKEESDQLSIKEESDKSETNEKSSNTEKKTKTTSLDMF